MPWFLSRADVSRPWVLRSTAGLAAPPRKHRLQVAENTCGYITDDCEPMSANCKLLPQKAAIIVHSQLMVDFFHSFVDLLRYDVVNVKFRLTTYQR